MRGYDYTPFTLLESVHVLGSSLSGKYETHDHRFQEMSFWMGNEYGSFMMLLKYARSKDQFMAMR